MRIEKKERKVVLEASESEFRFLIKVLRTARERYWERMHMLPSSAFEDVEILKKGFGILLIAAGIRELTCKSSKIS